MKYLNTDLKIFEFEDGETHWIAAENKEDAVKWYETQYAEADVLKEGYEVRELPKDTKMEINVSEDEDLINILNRHRSKDEKTNHANIWLYLQYWIIEEALKGNEFKVPNLVASSVF